MLSLSVGGVAFDFPETGESNWGDDVSAWATAISAQSLYKSGGSFVLTAETDFGSFFGLKSLYYKSRTANPASAGQVRLARADVVSWRNQLNSANLDLAVNASNQLTFGGVVLGLSSQPTFSDTATVDLTMNVNDVTADVIAGSLTNTHINAAAAIAYSKLNLTGTLLNADVNAAAAIAYSKLNLSASIVNADINASAAIAYSKLNLGTSIVNADVSATAAIAYSKLNLTGTLLNADINAAAAIAYSKLNLTGTLLNADINAAAAIAYSKLNLSASIVNADLSVSAAIARSKIAVGTANRLVYNLTGTGAMTDLPAITASRILQSDSSGLPVAGNAVTASRAVASDVNGFLVAATTTAAELGFVNGVTSAIQTQLNALTPGMTLIQVYSPAGAASVDLTSVITGTYDTYLIKFQFVPATDAVDLWLRTDTSNGASFDSGASDYGYHGITNTGTTTVIGAGSDAAAQIVICTTGLDNVVGGAGWITIDYLGSGTRYPQFTFAMSYLDDNGTGHVYRSGGGCRFSAAAINAVQLLMSSGNLTGTVRIYGLRNS